MRYGQLNSSKIYDEVRETVSDPRQRLLIVLLRRLVDVERSCRTLQQRMEKLERQGRIRANTVDDRSPSPRQVKEIVCPFQGGWPY